MTDEIEIAAPSRAAEVIDLAVVQQWADRVWAFWQRTVEGIHGMCGTLAAARDDPKLGATGFRLMFHDQVGHCAHPLPISYKSGLALNKVGGNAALMGDFAHVRSLPTSWGSWIVLDRLQQLDHERFVGAIEAGEINAESERSDLAALLAKWRYERRQQAFYDDAASEGERWEMIGEDFRDVALDEPVDAILTDPPYPDEHLPLWAALGKWASAHLRPGGVLIAWSGVRRLPEILPALGEHLEFGWALRLDLPGTQSRILGASLFQSWKPVLVYVKDHWPPHDWGPDYLTSPTREKSRYEWEQNVEPAIDALDRFVAPGGLVVDPFCGVGSFGVAALRSGRRFVGIEVDEDRYRESCQRLGQWTS